MKYLAFFMFFYFSALTVLPAVKVVKMHFAENCESSCHKNKTSETNDGGCQKEKCLLNFSMNSYTYVLFSNAYEFKNETRRERRVTLFLPQFLWLTQQAPVR